MSRVEKHLILGKFINQVLVKNIAIPEIDKLINNPIKEVQYVNYLRWYIYSHHSPYELAWDVKTRKIHFYLSKKEAARNNYLFNMFMTNESA